jgi:dipeptidase
MLAVVKGRHWCAQRIPDDEVAVIPNHFTIREVNLADASRFLGSGDLAAYAQKSGWYDPAKDGAFDFKRAFARTSGPDLVSDRNTLRHWRGLNLLSERKWDLSDAYPFSFKPGRKVAPESLMAVLRDHYEGTEYDATDGYKRGTPNRTKYRTICTSTTITAFIASLKIAGPEPLRVALWIALAKPDTTAFLPLYALAALPPSAGVGPDDHDDARLAKQHFEDAELRAQKDRLLHTKVLALQTAAEANYAPMRGLIDGALGSLEHELVANRPKFEAGIAALYAKDKAEALRQLAAYEAEAFEKAGALTDRLLKK